MMLNPRPLLLLAALAACSGGDGDGEKDTTVVPTDTDNPYTDTDHDTDHVDTVPVDTTNFRPLCLEAATPPIIAPDIVAWGEALVNSDNKFYGEEEWRMLEAAGDNLGPTPERVVMNHIQRGWQRLKFNDLTGAIEDFEAAEALSLTDSPRWTGRARQLLGIAWMRKAETDNCITNPTGHACIIPFDAEGMHADPIGMRNGATALYNVLEEDIPDSHSTRWLYNVTYMARGLWPAEVDAAWVYPANILDTEQETAGWYNYLPGLGITHADVAGGTTLQDFDGDGRIDLLHSTMIAEGGMHLYLNMGDGHFCDASDQSGVSSITGMLSFSVADYDNDGDIDVAGPRAAWMSTEGTVRPSLLRNDGQGHFVDVATAAGLNTAANGPTQVSVWADVDNDGWLDLFIGREDDELGFATRRLSSLFHSNGDGTFTDIAVSAGVASAGFVKGASFLDFDDDGFQDLYVSSLKGPNRLYRNRGDLTFVDIGERFGVTDPFKSFATGAFDYNQDGRVDIFVAAFTNNYAGGGPLDPSYFQSAESYLLDKLGLADEIDPLYSEYAHLYRNDGDAFTDVTIDVGLDDIHATMGMSWGDIDMDGFPEPYLATGAPEYDALEPNTAYRNDGGNYFYDVTTATRTGHVQKGHGTSFGDIDEDGDEDLYVSAGGAFRGDPSPDLLFGNPSNADGVVNHHAITLRLEGVTANRSAIGAKVEVVTPGRSFWQTVGQTGSFGGNSLQLEFGLADQTEITEVRVRWPGASDNEVITGVPLDEVSVIRQGQGVVDHHAYARIELYKHDAPH
jgi:hypothetical protein